MNESDTSPLQRLERLLTEAGYTTIADEGNRFGILFIDRHREWLIWARATGDWLSLRTYLCSLPDEAVLRTKVERFVLETNGAISLGKFAVLDEKLVLDLEYRFEHVDAEVLSNLVGLTFAIVSENFPRIFRIVSGDETLRALETSAEAA